MVLYYSRGEAKPMWQHEARERCRRAVPDLNGVQYCCLQTIPWQQAPQEKETLTCIPLYPQHA